MKTEITVAAHFITSLLEEEEQENNQQKHLFLASLQQALFEKYFDHWFPARPEQGQAYRAICINQKPDSILEQVSRTSGVSLASLPAELIIWIDPMCVSYKAFDGGVITLYDEYDAFNNMDTLSYALPITPDHLQQRYSQARSINYPQQVSPSASPDFRAATASPISIKKPNSSLKALSPPRQQASLPTRREITAV